MKHMIRTRKLYDLRTVGNTVFNLSTKGYIYIAGLMKVQLTSVSVKQIIGE